MVRRPSPGEFSTGTPEEQSPGSDNGGPTRPSGTASAVRGRSPRLCDNPERGGQSAGGVSETGLVRGSTQDRIGGVPRNEGMRLIAEPNGGRALSDQDRPNQSYFSALELLVAASELPPGLGRDKLMAQALKLDPNALVPPKPARM